MNSGGRAPPTGEASQPQSPYGKAPFGDGGSVWPKELRTKLRSQQLSRLNSIKVTLALSQRLRLFATSLSTSPVTGISTSYLMCQSKFVARGVTIPYWVWVWECKNYGHKVPVDDAEEFHAKLEQVGADRTKGTMITPVGFDTGTVEYAKSKGIGLWRYMRLGSLVSFMVDTRGVAESDILNALTTAETTDFRFYGFFYGLTCDGQFTTDRDFLFQGEFKDALEP